jgi:hypothetical protein
MVDKKLTTYSEFIKLSSEIGVDKAYEQLSSKGFNQLTSKKDHIDSFLLFWRERFGEDEKVDIDFVFDKSYPHIFGEIYESDIDAASRWLGEKLYYRLVEEDLITAADITDEIRKSVNMSGNIIDSMFSDKNSIYKDGILMVDFKK